MLKKFINDFVRLTGYQLIKVPYSNRKIKSGSYKWLQDLNINTILDIGANEGQFTKVITQILPGVQVYSFEPLKVAYEIFKSQFKGNNKIEIFNFALGDEDKQSSIYKNEFSASSSVIAMTELLKEAFPFSRSVTEEKITIKRLDDFSYNLNLNKEILMKIDVQGFELNVLKGAENTLRDVKLIIVETSFFELYQKQPLFKDVYNYLIRNGFNYFGSLEQIYDERDGKILQSDSIFLRS